MRSLVRTLGLLLIAFGAFLWLYAAKIAPANRPVAPVAVVPAAKPAPPPSKSRHHNQPAVPNTRTPPTPTSPPSHPAPAVPEPMRPPVSTVRLFYVNPQQHEFKIDLKKQDGWFDTGIPVTADVEVLEFCLSDTPGIPACGGWIQAMIGGTLFRPDSENGAAATIHILALPPGQNATAYQFGPGLQMAHISPDAFQTLKLKIADPNGSDELKKVMVKIYVRPVDPNQSQQLTAAQQRELAELGKWVKQ